jgi:hypothetical protein
MSPTEQPHAVLLDAEELGFAAPVVGDARCVVLWFRLRGTVSELSVKLPLEEKMVLDALRRAYSVVSTSPYRCPASSDDHSAGWWDGEACSHCGSVGMPEQER